MNFLSNAVTFSVSELDQSSLHIKGIELDQDYTGDQKKTNLAKHRLRDTTSTWAADSSKNKQV